MTIKDFFIHNQFILVKLSKDWNTRIKSTVVLPEEFRDGGLWLTLPSPPVHLERICLRLEHRRKPMQYLIQWNDNSFETK